MGDRHEPQKLDLEPFRLDPPEPLDREWPAWLCSENGDIVTLNCYRLTEETIATVADIVNRAREAGRSDGEIRELSRSAAAKSAATIENVCSAETHHAVMMRLIDGILNAPRWPAGLHRDRPAPADPASTMTLTVGLRPEEIDG
jgi:hypothetical protein